ncbi:AraC family transcriptional regulator [Paractinoplanes rishiriensis]|uniref:AraC family transcriptional regulator n=1 Tax=Paractinoplanes rishiriensis TaxID=1050105 RepID=A0A919MY96_9ACTN|nr:AraC family transcriptional regulator [Actinoplanes rishiriensis]GIE99908.1 AraC family transcriptional regulator [Actinoplanes rishiriensis]
MDLLSATLRELRLESAGYRWLELGRAARVAFDRAGLRGVHHVARGHCELVQADGTVQPLTAGDLVIFPRGDAHLLRSPEAGTGPVVSSFDLAMRTPGNRLRAGGPGTEAVVVCGAFLVGEADHPAWRGLPRTIHLPGVDGRPPDWLATLLEALAAEVFDGGPGSDLVMARLSDALIVRALRHYGHTDDRPGWLSGLRDPYVAPALEAIHADPGRAWTVAGLASTAGLSRAAFAARFTRQVGEPVMRYVLTLRMQRAKALLRDGHTTVAAVAGRLGYRSDVAFAAAFKRETGSSPGAYRRS